jgi:serine/threonine protein kinase
MLTTVDGRLACKLIDFSIAAVAQESREEVRQPPRWAQKLGQLQPFLAVFPQERLGHLASFGFNLTALSLEVSATLQTGTTSLAALAGTPHYMSPEQVRPGVVVTAQTDLWSLGILLFEARPRRKRAQRGGVI